MMNLGARSGSHSFLVLAMTVVLGTTGCLSDDELSDGVIECPSPEGFRDVNRLLERRCGTLDCHGHGARPFVVFGQAAYRRPGGEEFATDPTNYFPGGAEPTLEFEVAGTFESACQLEPEKMTAVVRGVATDETLTLTRKPRLDEKHKGGRIWQEGSTAERCMLSWINGATDVAACREAQQQP